MIKIVECDKCHKWITRAQAEYSMKKYAKYLCFTCQRLEYWKKEVGKL